MATNDNTPTPTTSNTSDDTSTLFGTEGAAGAATDAPAEPKARAPRKRAAAKRTSKKAAAAPQAEAAPAPAAADVTDASSTAESAGLDAGAGEPADEAAAPAAKKVAKRAPRKRASRAKTTVTPTEPTEPADRAAAAIEELVAAQTTDADPTADADPSADPTAEATAVVDPDALVETDLAVEADASDESDGSDDEDDDAAATQSVPSLSLLFQAPEPSAPTRRRRAAVRDAGPVTPAAEATEAAEVVAPEEEQEPAPAPTRRGRASKRAAATERPERTERTHRSARADSALADDAAASPDTDEDADEADDATTPPAEDEESTPRRSRRRRGGKGRRGRGAGDAADDEGSDDSAGDGGEGSDDAAASDQGDGDGQEPDDRADAGDDEGPSSRRRRRRRRAGSSPDSGDDTPNVSTRVRQPRAVSDEPTGVKGSTRLEAKKQRRREGREAGRRRTVITEAEFLARREAVDRVMVVRNRQGRTQMGVLEDGVLVEHYIDQATNVSMAGNIYLGRVQNVLPSMEAAFVDIGKGRNAVLYAGEVNWDAAGLEVGQPKRIENALGSGQAVLVQVTKDPIGHKGARLTSQISLPGRYLVYVPNASMTGISRKLPDTERARLKKILREVVPESAGVIVRTAAEGASEEELRADVERLTRTWEEIQSQAEASITPKAGKSKGRKKNGGTGSSTTGTAPMLLHGEPDLTVRVIRDVFNEDFKQLVVQGDQAWDEIHPYITSVAPDLADRVTKWTSEEDLFVHHRVDEQLAKAMDRKVWLPSGGSLVIDRTEAMTVVDVNTGKFVGSGGNLEETVTKNNIEAAEEIVRQLRLRDIGGIIVIDFIDMVLESNRDLVVRRLLECLGRDRTKHQVAEVTSLGLVQMTRKRVGSGLIEVFSETCQHCNGRGFIIHTDPVDRGAHQPEPQSEPAGGGRRRGGRSGNGSGAQGSNGGTGGNGGNGQSGNGQSGQAQPAEQPKHSGPTAAQIAAAAHAAAMKTTTAALDDGHPHAFPDDSGPWAGDDVPAEDVGTDAPVELESDVPEADVEADVAVEQHDDDTDHTDAPATSGAVGSAPEVIAEIVSDAPVEASIEVEPAPRGRRRRGRVVAPAGPPRGSVGGDA